MEHDVVDLVVAVHKRRAVFGLRVGIREEGDHVVLVRDLADGLAGVFVFGCGLREGDCVEGGDLAVVEARGLAVGGEVDRGGLDAVEFGEGGYGGVPPALNVLALGLGIWQGERSYIFVRSSGVTSGMAGSSKMRPSRNSMM